MIILFAAFALGAILAFGVIPLLAGWLVARLVARAVRKKPY